jgi:Myb/SANT-like DNA-binding protein
MNKQMKRQLGSSSTSKRGYVSWTPQMDAILASTLIDQINEGNKGEGDFKPQAYQAVVDKLRNELGIFIMMEHAKNRIKVWKKHHAIITDIKTYTKFTWNDEKKMLEIGMNDFAQWNEYCKVCFSNYRSNTIKLYPYVRHFVLLLLMD